MQNRIIWTLGNKSVLKICRFNKYEYNNFNFYFTQTKPTEELIICFKIKYVQSDFRDSNFFQWTPIEEPIHLRSTTAVSHSDAQHLNTKKVDSFIS